MKISPLSSIDIRKSISTGIDDKNLAVITSGLNFIDRLALKYRSSVKIGEYMLEGWSKRLPLYLFKCDEHGFQISFPVGYNELLVCPLCIDEKSRVSDVQRKSEAAVEEPPLAHTIA